MRLVVLFVAVVISFSLSAQRNSRVDTDTIPNWSITFSPSALLNEFSGIQFGVEKRINDIWSTELEYAYIFPQDISSPLEESQKVGFRTKLGFKRNTYKNLDLLLTMYYRRTVHDFRGNFSRFGGQFNQIIDYKITKTLIGPAFGLVWDVPLNNRFRLETGSSTGIGYYVRRSSDLPEDARSTNFDQGIFEPDATGEDWYPIIALHLKLKFRVI